MGSTVTDRITGVSTSVAIKAPVKAITQGNISLSGLGVQAGGSWSESLTAGDRVLVKDQADAAENGVYTAFTSEWRRATDFNGYRDVVKGTSVPLESTGDRYRVITDNPIIIGTSEINFQLHPQDARIIPVSSRTAMKAYDVPPGTQFSLEEGSRSGRFVVKSGTPPSDPQEGVYVALDNGNYAERMYGQNAMMSNTVHAGWWGVDGSGDDTDAIQAGMDFVSANLGGLLQFGAGTFEFTRLTIVDDVILQGLGQAKTLLLCTDNSTNDPNVSFGSALKKADDGTRANRFGMKDIGLQGDTSQTNMQNVIGLNLCACERGRFDNVYIANFGQAAIMLARASAGAEGLGFLNTEQDGNYNTFTAISIFNAGQFGSARSAVEFKRQANSNKFYGVYFKGGIDRAFNFGWANDNAVFGGAVESAETVARFSTSGISNQVFGVRGEGISGDAYIFENGASFNVIFPGRLTSLGGEVYTFDALSERNIFIGLDKNYQKNYSIDPTTISSSDHNNGLAELTGLRGDADYPLFVKSKAYGDASKYPEVSLLSTVTVGSVSDVLGRIGFYCKDASAGAEGTSAAIEAVLENTTGGTGLSFKTGTGSSLAEHLRINRNGVVSMPSLPTSSAGLSSGDLWNDAGTLKIVP